MKGKPLAIILAAAAVLGSVGLLLHKNSGDSWKDSGNTAPGGKVIDLAADDVAHITIKTHTSELNLVKKDDDWVVQERAGYPASFDPVANLLRKIWSLKTVQEVKVGASQFGRMELEAPEKDAGSGTRIEFKGKDGKSLGGLLIGKRYMRKADDQSNEMGVGGQGGYAVGRYVMPLGTTNVFLVVDPLEDVVPNAEQWLDHDFIKATNIVSLTLAGPTPTHQWKVTRPNVAESGWVLDAAKPDETLDPGKVTPVATVLSTPGFVDVLPSDAKPADTGLDNPTVLTAETADQLTYTLKIGKLMGENYPVTVEVASHPAKERTPGKDEKPEDKAKLDEDFKAAQKSIAEKFATEKKYEGHIYTVTKFTIDELVKDRSALMKDKAPESAPGTPVVPGTSGVPGIPGLPPGHPGVMTPPPGGPRKPISATTPPISVATPPVSAPAAPQNPPAATTPPVPPTPPTNAKPPVINPPPPKPAPPADKPAPPAAPPTPAAPATPAPEAAKPAPAPATPAPAPTPPTPSDPKPAIPPDKPAPPADK